MVSSDGEDVSESAGELPVGGDQSESNPRPVIKFVNLAGETEFELAEDEVFRRGASTFGERSSEISVEQLSNSLRARHLPNGVKIPTGVLQLRDGVTLEEFPAKTTKPFLDWVAQPVGLTYRSFEGLSLENLIAPFLGPWTFAEWTKFVVDESPTPKDEDSPLGTKGEGRKFFSRGIVFTVRVIRALDLTSPSIPVEIREEALLPTRRELEVAVFHSARALREDASFHGVVTRLLHFATVMMSLHVLLEQSGKLGFGSNLINVILSLVDCLMAVAQPSLDVLVWRDVEGRNYGVLPSSGFRRLEIATGFWHRRLNDESQPDFFQAQRSPPLRDAVLPLPRDGHQGVCECEPPLVVSCYRGLDFLVVLLDVLESFSCGINFLHPSMVIVPGFLKQRLESVGALLGEPIDMYNPAMTLTHLPPLGNHRFGYSNITHDADVIVGDIFVTPSDLFHHSIVGESDSESDSESEIRRRRRNFDRLNRELDELMATFASRAQI